MNGRAIFSEAGFIFEELIDTAVFRQLLPFPGIFECSAGGGIGNFDLKRKAVSKRYLGVENSNGLRRAQTEPKQDAFRLLFDFRADSTVDGGRFHGISALRLQHTVKFFLAQPNPIV